MRLGSCLGCGLVGGSKKGRRGKGGKGEAGGKAGRQAGSRWMPDRAVQCNTTTLRAAYQPASRLPPIKVP